MLNKFKTIWNKHKYAFSIFVFFIVYNFVVVCDFSFPKIDRITYTFHIVDYSIGFCSKLLPGAIYNALFSTTQAGTVNLYFFILYHVFLLAVSFMLEKFLYKFDLENRLTAFIIVMFFITGPATFSIHAVRFGMLDTYWLFFSAAFLIMVQNKYLKWLVPIIFVLSIFIHVSAMISFVPFFALIVLLEASRNEKGRNSYVFIFAVSIFLTVAVFIYFTIAEEHNLSLSFDSFQTYISERNISEWEDYPHYYNYALYRVSADGGKMANAISEGESSFITQILGAFLLQMKETFRLFPTLGGRYRLDAVNDIFLLIPMIVLLYKYVFSAFKKDKKNKSRRFVWFCALCLLPFTFVAAMLCSCDITRWFSHGVILLFALVMYEIYRSSDIDSLEALNKRINHSSFFPVIIYFVFYMMCTVDPYS